jgi:hypothetical protein
MSFLFQRRDGVRRRGDGSPPGPTRCPACGLAIDEDDHAVYVRRAAYHAACLLYRGRAERGRWTVSA